MNMCLWQLNTYKMGRGGLLFRNYFQACGKVPPQQHHL